jgi:tRNA-binding EMAP/Myf-like protein
MITVANILHKLPISAGNSAPKYFATNICGIANARPDTKVIQNTPFIALKLFLVKITNANGIIIMNGAN